jgi:hypothetical protein
MRSNKECDNPTRILTVGEDQDSQQTTIDELARTLSNSASNAEQQIGSERKRLKAIVAERAAAETALADFNKQNPSEKEVEARTRITTAIRQSCV